MVECPNCKTTCSDPFCTGCGADLTQLQQAGDADAQTSSTSSAAATALAPALPVVTLSFGDRIFPISRGQTLVIARKGTDKCTPDLDIDSDNVSSTPVEVSVGNDDTITIRDTGTSKGIRVVRNLQPGESIEAKPGDMIMLGDEIIQTS